MDILTMIHGARKAGVTLTINGNRLVARGPKSAERIVRQLAEHRSAVMLALLEAQRCKYRCDERHWIVDHANGLPDRERVICGRCRRFIGYRPAASTSGDTSANRPGLARSPNCAGA